LERYPAVFALPKPNVHEQLAELEARVGRIPLSLYAWFETVGSVNLVGSYPVEDPRDPEGFNNWAQYRRADPAEERLREYEDSSRWTDLHDLDPLFVYPIERALRRTTYVLSSTGQRLSSIEIAPDEQAKYELGGEDNYRIQVPDATADACLEGEWHETTFVDYLRICFRWGGFPGLHSRTRIPTHELAYLTRDLLPV